MRNVRGELRSSDSYPARIDAHGTSEALLAIREAQHQPPQPAQTMGGRPSSGFTSTTYASGATSRTASATSSTDSATNPSVMLDLAAGDLTGVELAGRLRRHTVQRGAT